MNLNKIFQIVKKEGKVVVYDSRTGEAFRIESLGCEGFDSDSNCCREGLTPSDSVDKINREIAMSKEDDFDADEFYANLPFDDDEDDYYREEDDYEEGMYYDDEEDDEDLRPQGNRKADSNRWSIPKKRRKKIKDSFTSVEDEDKQYLEEIPF